MNCDHDGLGGGDVKNGKTTLTESARDAVLRITLGAISSRLLYLAVRLRIPDLLTVKQGMAVRQLTARTAMEPKVLRRLLRALASLGLVHEDGEGRFSLTAHGEVLRSESPESLRDWVLFMNETADAVWSAAVQAIGRGGSVFETGVSRSLYAHLGESPGVLKQFHSALGSVSRDIDQAIIDTLDFGDVKLFVDVGGGEGALLRRLLERYPHASGILFDRPEVVQMACKPIERLGTRCRGVAGDFFREVPAGGDVYLLKFVLHDWGEEEAITILQNCRSAMAEGGRIVIIQGLLPEGAEPSPLFLWDIHMLVMSGGGERTLEEYRKLLDRAGLRLARVESAATGISILEAVAGC